MKNELNQAKLELAEKDKEKTDQIHHIEDRCKFFQEENEILKENLENVRNDLTKQINLVNRLNDEVKIFFEIGKRELIKNKNIDDCEFRFPLEETTSEKRSRFV